nr:Intermediate filament protein [Polyrhizophydium stewartii]
MLVHHPRLAVALALLPLLAWASPLLRRVVLNAAAALALLVLAGLWTAARDARLGRSELARLRDRSGFFLTEADARRVAARHGAPVRQFPLSSTAYWERLGTLRRKETAPARTPQYIANPQIQASLDDLVAFVARDFVASWFAHISSDPEPAFVGQVKLALHHVLAELKMRIDRVDMAQLIVARVAPALAAHARDMSAAEKMLRAERRQKTPIGQDELDNLLARYYRPKGGLHPAVFVNRDLANKPERSSRLELEHLRSRIKPIVPLLLQRSDSGSRVLVTLLREILVCRILQPVSEMLSDPDYWSQTFGSLAETLIQQEQSLGRKFGDAYSREDTQDAIGFEPGRTGVHGAPNVEELVKKLMASTTVGDASRIREQISDTLKRKRAEIVGFDKDDIFNGMQVASIREYIGQLQDAQKRADKHIASLSRDKSKRSHLNDAESAGLARPPFSKVLEDAQMLTFFSDYMSTTARLRLIVFFMRAQDALRRLGISDFNPRELEATISTQAALSESADFMTVCSDIHTLCKDYFVRDAPSRIGDVSPATTRGLQALGEVLSHGNETQSREALFSQGDLRFLLQAVRETYEAMERDDYPSFLKSPAYARMANALLAESTSQPRPSAASNLTPAQPGTPSASQGASKPGEDSPMLPPRTSHEAEWSSLDMIAAAPGDADAADPPEDSQRRIRGRSLFGSVFKGMLKSPQKPPITDGSSSLEGDLHVAANVDDGQFAAQSRKRSSWLFGDDRLFGSREDVSKDAKRTDSADLPQQQGSLTTGGAAASVNRRHSNPGIPPYNSDDPSGDGGADSEPEGAQFFQVGGGQLGDDDDDDDARMLLGEASILTLSGVPRSRNELLARFRNDQDILPTMIAIPLRVMQINDDLAALRGELDENMRQRAALDASPRRSLHDLAAPAASSDRTNDASSQSRQAKLLHFAGLGIEEAMKRLLAEKRRFELDELDNVIMPERVSISVGESQTASSDDGKDFAIYPVQVQRVNVDGVVSGWYVMRRYREFWSLHATLRARYPSIVMQYDMPGKMLNNIIKLRKQTLEMRRTALEKYLQNLSRHVEICRTVEFRQFLCHPNISRLLFSNEGSDHPMRRSLLKNIFQTVDGGIDSFRQKLRVPPSLHTQSTLQHQQDPQHQHHDVHFDQPVHHQHEHLQPIELRQMQQEQDRQAQLQLRQQPQQQLSMHQSFSQSAHTADAGLSGSLVQPLSQSQTSACSFLSDPGAGYGTPPAAFSAAFPSGASPPFVGGGQTRFAGIYGAQVAAEGSSSSLPLSMAGSEAGPAQTSATDAMIDLFIELFELKEKNNWLRRQAVVIFLQQLFGGTVERRVNESLRWAVSEDNTAYVLSSVLNMFWPKGVWNPQFGPPRTAEAKRRTFTDTQSKLAMLLPEYVGGMVGRQNARRGALRWCGLFQNRLLNQHLIYTLLDDILGALFPEAVK